MAMARLIEDLRFVIGLFFLIISVILLGLGLFSSELPAHGMNLNLGAGAVMAVFSALMLTLAVYSSSKQ
jgi:hypothetical protein